MPALRKLQRNFAQALRVPQATIIESHLSCAHASERIQLYRLTVAGILGKALESVYPVCVRLVGTRCFDSLARHYLRGTPSRSGDLHDMGGPFADFLANTSLAADLPYLSEMARLEWAYHRVFHAADSPALDTQRLSEIDPAHCGALVFKLAPACGLLEASYPIHLIWAANQPDQDGSLSITQTATHLLIQRRANRIELLPLSRDEYMFLHSLQTGQPLATAVAAALAADDQFNPNDTLLRHVARATLIDFVPPPETPI